MKSLIQALRFFFKFIVPAIFVSAYILKLRFPEKPYLNSVYVILLSTIVGYFTNFIAIKMLFRPKAKTIFGRQGLIPRNQDEIAERLGAGISDNFFSPDDIISHINRNNIAAHSISSVKLYLERKLNDRATQQAITAWILEGFRKNSQQIHQILIQLSEKNLARHLEAVDLNTFVKGFAEFIERNIQNGTIDLQEIARGLTTFLYKNIPEISQTIYEQLQTYMAEQGVVKKNAMKFAVWVTRFDQDKLAQKLTEIISSPYFRNEIYLHVEIAASRLAPYLNSEIGAEKVNHYYKRFIIEIDAFVKSKGIPLLMQKMEALLQKNATWESIENIIDIILNFLEGELEKFVMSEKFNIALKNAIPSVLAEIDISSIVTEKVKAFDTHRLEKLIHDASGEHLGAIEVLGGFLGGFAGIALLNATLFIFLLMGLLAIGGLESLLDKLVSKGTFRFF